MYCLHLQAYGFTTVSTDDIATFIGRLLQLGEFGLVKLAYSAGVEASPHHYQHLATSTADSCEPLQRALSRSSMLYYIDRLVHNPRHLADLCRRNVRRQIASNVLSLVGQLDVRDSVKDYICIMDTDHYTDV